MGIKITDLPLKSALTGTEEFVINDNGNDNKTTVNNIRNNLEVLSNKIQSLVSKDKNTYPSSNAILTYLENNYKDAEYIEQLESHLEQAYIQNPEGDNGLYGRKKNGTTYEWTIINPTSMGISAKDISYNPSTDNASGIGKALYDLSLDKADDVISEELNKLYSRSYDGTKHIWQDITDKVPSGINTIELYNDDYCPTSSAIRKYVHDNITNVYKTINNNYIPYSNITYIPVDKTYNYYTTSGLSNYSAKYLICPIAGLKNDKLTSLTIYRRDNKGGFIAGSYYLIVMIKENETWKKIGISKYTEITNSELTTTFEFDELSLNIDIDTSKHFYLMLSKVDFIPQNLNDWTTIRLAVLENSSESAWTGSGLADTNGTEIFTHCPAISFETKYYKPYNFVGNVTYIYNYNNDRLVNAEIFNDQNNKALGAGSHAEGISTTAGADNAYAAHAEGYTSKAYGMASHAEGYGSKTEVNSQGAHAEGYATTAAGLYSHAEGIGANLSGLPKVREYQGAVGRASHVEGGALNEYYQIMPNDAIGDASHAEGALTTATGDYSHAEGLGNNSIAQASHIEGKWAHSTENTIHAVGIGTDDNNRKSAHEIMDDGYHYICGLGGFNGVNVDNAVPVQDLYDNIRYTSNRAKLDAEYAEALAASHDLAVRQITTSNDSKIRVIGDNFNEVSVTTLQSGDTVQFLSTGNFKEYANITGSGSYTKDVGSLDRLFSAECSRFKSDYQPLINVVTEIDYADFQLAKSICSTFERSAVKKINHILPTKNCLGATGLFYGDQNSTSTNRNLIWFAGMDCSSILPTYNKRPGWTGEFHPFIAMFGTNYNNENNYCSQLRNLPIFRNLKYSIDDIRGNKRSGFAELSHIFQNEGATTYQSNENIDKQIIDFMDSLGIGDTTIYNVNPTDGRGGTIGNRAYIAFHSTVYDKIKERAEANYNVKSAIKYAMNNKNWVFTKHSGNPTYEEYLHF